MKTVTLILCLALAACGGGGCNPCEPEQQTPKTDCAAKPEACK